MKQLEESERVQFESIIHQPRLWALFRIKIEISGEKLKLQGEKSSFQAKTRDFGAPSRVEDPNAPLREVAREALGGERARALRVQPNFQSSPREAIFRIKNEISGGKIEIPGQSKFQVAHPLV